MNRFDLTRNYWKYYLVLEKKFLESMEYVELDKSNFKTFSNEYALLIQAIGGELDTVFKEFCGYCMKDRKSIADYATYILEHNSAIVDSRIRLQGYDIKLQPFENWSISSPGKSLCWWNSYTELKHNRYNNFRLANQKNVVHLLSALYLIEMMLLKKITENNDEFDVFDEPSRLFTIENWKSRYNSLNGLFAQITGEVESIR